jgi:hypothetical protein
LARAFQPTHSKIKPNASAMCHIALKLGIALIARSWPSYCGIAFKTFDANSDTNIIIDSGCRINSLSTMINFGFSLRINKNSRKRSIR